MRAWCAAKWLGMNTGSPGFDGCPMHNNVPALTPKTASAVIASGRFCASMRLRHLHIHVRRSEAIQCFACANRHGLPHRGAPLHEPLDHGCVLRRGVCIGSKSKLSPACGRRGPFQGGKGPKTPCAGSHVGAAPAAPIPCASRRMRAGTNSGIHALTQWCLAPAFGCDARRALRRVVALDRASLRYDSPACETAALSTQRLSGSWPVWSSRHWNRPLAMTAKAHRH